MILSLLQSLQYCPTLLHSNILPVSLSSNLLALINIQVKTSSPCIMPDKLECIPSLSCNWVPPIKRQANTMLTKTTRAKLRDEISAIKIPKNPYPPEINGTNLLN